MAEVCGCYGNTQPLPSPGGPSMASQLLRLTTPRQKRVREVTVPIGSTCRRSPAWGLGVHPPCPPVDPFLRSPWCCDVGPARPRPRWGDGEMGPPPLPSPTSAFCNGRKIPFPPGRAPRSRRFGLPSFLGHVACLLTLSRACSSAPRGLWNSAVPRKISSPGILHYWSPEETHDFY